ncbi:MAG: pentapeptide repeat-containing protein, partial [Spirochaetales bacterium]|nr:pentapeptide repeat-containing protein [Spirochaetales bacterium]
MFNFKTCSHNGCHTYVCEDGPYCYRHSSDQERLKQNWIEMLLSENDMIDFSLTGCELEDLALPKKSIIASNMAWCTFRNIDFSHTTL